MKLNAECRECLRIGQKKRAAALPDDTRKQTYFAAIDRLCDSFPEDTAAPLLMRAINREHCRIYGGSVDYSAEKETYNRLCLKHEHEFAEIIGRSDDSLLTAVRFAQAGNRIDFAKFASMEDNLVEVICRMVSEDTDVPAEYTAMKTAIQSAKKITYLLDNAGEIVMDKLLIREIRRQNPAVAVTAVVRGKEILNDCTITDADTVGLNEVADVIGNGNDIPGTYLPELTEQCRQQMETSDIIIAKGLGNFETLYGSLLPVYYLFLCKCRHFSESLHIPMMSTVLLV